MTDPERCERPKSKYATRASGYKVQLASRLEQLDERLDGQDFLEWAEAVEAIDLTFRLFCLRLAQALEETTDES